MKSPAQDSSAQIFWLHLLFRGRKCRCVIHFNLCQWFTELVCPAYWDLTNGIISASVAALPLKQCVQPIKLLGTARCMSDWPAGGAPVMNPNLNHFQMDKLSSAPVTKHLSSAKLSLFLFVFHGQNGLLTDRTCKSDIRWLLLPKKDEHGSATTQKRYLFHAFIPFFFPSPSRPLSFSVQ